MKRVSEVMLPLDQYATTSSRSTVRDAMVALNKAQLGLTNNRHHHRAVLVLDDEGKVIGKLTHWSVLRCLQPQTFSDEDQDALERTGLSPAFIKALAQHHPLRGSLEQMCAAASRVKVSDAMAPVDERIDENARMCHAIAIMVERHAQSILVTREGVVVGILRLSDVFEEVADAIRGPGPR